MRQGEVVDSCATLCLGVNVCCVFAGAGRSGCGGGCQLLDTDLGSTIPRLCMVELQFSVKEHEIMGEYVMIVSE